MLLVINHHAVRHFICFSTIMNQHGFHLQSKFDNMMLLMNFKVVLMMSFSKEQNVN